MNNRQKAAKPEAPKSVMDAIYHRRAVRNYTPRTIARPVIRNLLNRLSDSAKERVRNEAQGSGSHHAKHSLELVDAPDFHVFYNAGTLIVIYSKFQGPFVVADCWLAAENLMLAACAKGLGTCVIGFAVSALNSPEWKAALKIPARMTAVAPIIVGVPAGATPPVPRKQPKIIIWK